MRSPVILLLCAIALVAALMLEVAQSADAIDESRIAFIRAGDIWVMAPDGFNQRQVTRIGGCRHPSWSPDGTELVFSGWRDDGWALYAVSFSGGGLRRLTTGPGDYDPEWSPEGERIIFRRSDELDSDICVLDLGTESVARVISGPTFDFDPSWHPDGRRIIFVRSPNHDGPEAGIYMANADGTGVHRSFSIEERCESPRFSPDGRRIAFQRFRDGWQILVCASDTSNLRSITEQTLCCTDPSWSPDGDVMACCVMSKGRSLLPAGVRVLSVGGSSSGLFVTTAEEPAWSRRIAFLGGESIGGGSPGRFRWTDAPRLEDIPAGPIKGRVNGAVFEPKTVRIQRERDGGTLEISSGTEKKPGDMLSADVAVELSFEAIEGEPTAVVKAVEDDVEGAHAYYHYPMEDGTPMSMNPLWACALQITEWTMGRDPDSERIIGHVKGRVAITFDDAGLNDNVTVETRSWVAGEFDTYYYEW